MANQFTIELSPELARHAHESIIGAIPPDYRKEYIERLGPVLAALVSPEETQLDVAS